MMKKFSSVLALILALVLTLGVMPMSFAATAEVTIANFKNGETISFGSYPQRQVTDEKTIAALGKISATWNSFGFFCGNGTYGSSKASSFMKYADVTYNSKKYRAVKMTAFRPEAVVDKTSTKKGVSKSNGYEISKTYWFSFDSLKWEVIDAKNGLLLCTSIIDSQPFSNTLFEGENGFYGDKSLKNEASSYYYSSIRQWLNNDFYKTAFSTKEKSFLASFVTDSKLKASDKVFLLSKEDLTEASFGFSKIASDPDSQRTAKGTAYAACMGLAVASGEKDGGNSAWLLRSSGSATQLACAVSSDGVIIANANVSRTDFGVRPAISMSKTADMSAYVSKPAKTGGLKASSITSSSVSLKWNKVSGAQKYFVYWYDSSKKEYVKLGEKSTNSASLSSLKAATTYKIKIKAVKTVGKKDFEGSASSALTFKTLSENSTPAQVTGLKATQRTTKSVMLEWNPVKYADGYEVFWYSVKERKYVSFGKTGKTQGTVSKLDPSMGYSFKVCAYVNASKNKIVGGKQSAALSISTVSSSWAKSHKVSDVTTTARTTNSSTITWKKVSGATGYTVYQNSNGSWVKLADVTTNKYTVKKLKAATTYRFKIAAYTKSKELYTYGDDSAVLTTSTKPSAPKISAKANGKSTVTVSATKVSGATGYFLYYSQSQNGTYKRYTVTESNKHTVSLTRGKTYYFKAKAYRTVNSVNYVSEFSNTVKVKVK